MPPAPHRVVPFILDETYVRQDTKGRYSLNDLHQAASGGGRHRPSNWLRLEQTVVLINEIDRYSDLSNGREAVSVVQGGRAQGTFVVRELVYAYAMWISAAFHLKVIRTFDALATGRLTGGSDQVGAVSGLGAARMIGLQEQSWKLITRLRAERHPELRQALHAQLGAVLGDLGQAELPLESLGQDLPAAPAVVGAFWQVYAALEAKGARLNHSRQGHHLIAVNLRQFNQAAAEHKLRTPPLAELKHGLRLSLGPRFVDTRNVNSALLGHAVWCWVFEANEPRETFAKVQANSEARLNV